MSGAHIAAEHRRRKLEQEEEETMARYNRTDLNEEWEFKIVRNITGAFRKPETLQRVVAEEAQAGWQLLEKLDNNRLRFKRPVSARQRDAMLPAGVDPYRTQVGSGGTAIAVLIVGIMLMVGVGVGITAGMVVEEGGNSIGEVPWVLIVLMIGGLITVVSVIVAAVRMRG